MSGEKKVWTRDELLAEARRGLYYHFGEFVHNPSAENFRYLKASMERYQVMEKEAV